jgi:tripartite-type tricarboxylate transporter receptor subunit TctC
VGQLSRIACIVVVRPNFPAKTMQELIAVLKASPGKYTFASAGNGTTSHLAGEMLKSAANVDMVHVPYRGGAPAMTDLIAGQVDLMIEISANAAPQVKGGRVRALAVSTAQRIASFPDLPTIAESGVPGFDVSAWDGLFAPTGTPPEVIEVLSNGLKKALGSPELKQQFQDRGAEIALSSPAALGAFVNSEYKRWGDAVRRSGASVD